MNEKEKVKCSQCLKITLKSETDSCENCNKIFCSECLTYYGENSEMAFCGKRETK